MQPVPLEVWANFERRLDAMRVPPPQRPDYRKWVRLRQPEGKGKCSRMQKATRFRSEPPSGHPEATLRLTGSQPVGTLKPP